MQLGWQNHGPPDSIDDGDQKEAGYEHQQNNLGT